MTVVAEDEIHWRSIVYEGKVDILDEYAGREALLEKLKSTFVHAVEKLESKAAGDAVAREGLRSLHKHLPPHKVAKLEAMVRTQMRDDLYFWAQQLGRETIGLDDPFYVDMLIVLRIHYPFLVARESEAPEQPPYDLEERIRLGLAAILNPKMLMNQISRRVRKRAKIAEHKIAYDPKSYHGELPALARAHGAHIDTWYGHSFDGFNVWLSVDGVNSDNTVILYPELFGHRVEYDPRSMYLAEGTQLPKPTKVDLKPGQLLLFNPEMLHGTQVNISDETRVALTMRINPRVPRFNDDAPFNAEHWYASTDLAKRRYTRVSVFPANEYQGDPSIAQEPVPPGTLRRVSAENDGSGDIVLCSAVELDKSGQIAVDLGNRKLLLVKDENGTRAFNRRCPHRGIDLVDGYIDGQEAYCPGHGIAFSLSDGKSSCAALHLVRIGVVERDGQIVLPAERDKGRAAEEAALADG